MKRAHRNAHIGLWIVLTPLMAAIIFLAVSLRPVAPVNAELPTALTTEVD